MESKHHKLARSLRSGPSDHDLKPNAATRDQLNVSTISQPQLYVCLCVILAVGSISCVCLSLQVIVNYPPTKQLSSEEQDLVWKFRYYLTTQEKVCVLLSLKSFHWLSFLVHFICDLKYVDTQHSMCMFIAENISIQNGNKVGQHLGPIEFLTS